MNSQQKVTHRFQCNNYYFMNLNQVNQVLLALIGLLLVCELDMGSGMTIYTSRSTSESDLITDQREPNSNVNARSPLVSSSGLMTIQQQSFSEKKCPDEPSKHLKQLQSQLDAASKAYLSPIVFNGKLISISEDYGGRIGATFRVQKQIKNSSTSFVPNLATGSQVTLYFVRSKLAKSEPPFCAIYMNDNLVKLRPQEKYIVFASPPMTVFRTSTYINSNNYNVNVANNVNDANHVNRPTASSHTLINLSAFAPPELHTKRSSRMVRKVLCRRCGE